MRSDQHIKFPDRRSSFGQHAADSSELRSRGFVERLDFDGRRECVDEGTSVYTYQATAAVL